MYKRQLNYSQLLKVYRALLTEGVSLRDIVTIATVLVASSAVTKDHILLAADVRLACLLYASRCV